LVRWYLRERRGGNGACNVANIHLIPPAAAIIRLMACRLEMNRESRVPVQAASARLWSWCCQHFPGCRRT